MGSHEYVTSSKVIAVMRGNFIINMWYFPGINNLGFYLLNNLGFLLNSANIN